MLATNDRVVVLATPLTAAGMLRFAQVGEPAGVPLTLRLAMPPGALATTGRPGVAPSTKPP